jgi:hypothetical protein
MTMLGVDANDAQLIGLFIAEIVTPVVCGPSSGHIGAPIVRSSSF